MKVLRRSPPIATLLIYGSSRTAQFILAAGDIKSINHNTSKFLAERAIDTMNLVRAVDNTAIAGFRLRSGDVLMLGVPATNAVDSFGRGKLCVVYAVHVSKHWSSSDSPLGYFLLELIRHVTLALRLSKKNMEIAASAYTKILQEQGNDAARMLVSETVRNLSHIFTELIFDESWRQRMRLRSLRRDIQIAPLDEDYTLESALCAQTVRHIRGFSRVQFCYYRPRSLELISGSRVSASLFHLERVNTFSFLSSGFIIGHSVRRGRLPLRNLAIGTPPMSPSPCVNAPRLKTRHRVVLGILGSVLLILILTLIISNLHSGSASTKPRNISPTPASSVSAPHIPSGTPRLTNP